LLVAIPRNPDSGAAAISGPHAHDYCQTKRKEDDVFVINYVTLQIAGLFLVVFSVANIHADTGETLAAQQAATAWFSKLDADDFNGCWNEFATGPKAMIPHWRWNLSCKMGRFSFGRALSRKLGSSEFTMRSPGGRAGRFVILKFETSSEKKGKVQEQVIVMQDQDHQWRVAGYSIDELDPAARRGTAPPP
jgi:hypothetical protein